MPKVLHNAPIVQPWMPEAIVLQPELPTLHVPSEVSRANSGEHAKVFAARTKMDTERVEQWAYEKGLAQGREAGNRQYEERCAEVEAMAAELNREREAFFDRMEPELIRLAVAVAERILAQQITLQPSTIVEMMRAHLQRFRQNSVLTVRVHPEDAPILRDEESYLLDASPGVAEIQFVEDRRVSRGGAVFELPGGALDARISTQVSVVSKRLESALEAQHVRRTD